MSATPYERALAKANPGEAVDAMRMAKRMTKRQAAAAWRSEFSDLESAQEVLRTLFDGFKDAWGIET